MMLAEDDEGVVSFTDDDDDMAELFSFGAVIPEESSASSPEKKKEEINYKEIMFMQSVLPLSDDEEDMEELLNADDDSFLDLLDQQTDPMIVDPSTIGTQKNRDGKEEKKTSDVRMQEILDWLDADDENDTPVLVDEDIPPFEDEPFQAPTFENILTKPVEEPPKFESLKDALKSPKSTLSQIRLLLEKEGFVVTAKTRPHLWCRIICDKTLEETLQSSAADSFQQWEQQHKENSQEQEPSIKQQQLQNWIQKESSKLAGRIVMTLNGDQQLSQRALESILLNCYSVMGKKKATAPKNETETRSDGVDDDNHINETGQESEEQEDEEDQDQDGHDHHDPLLPPVACALLSAGVPKLGAAVMLTHIVPNFMPILALDHQERLKAAIVLHSQFYLLVRYHLPLLAVHLDRQIPNWYLASPSGGLLPQSWLLSHFAGECDGSFMNPRFLQCLWDLILTSSNNSLRFFMVMAILEQHAEQLLLLTGETLKAEIQRVLAFNENTTDDGLFAIEAEEQTTNVQAVKWVSDWTNRAQTLWEATPSSVVERLKQVEDMAVHDALLERQKQAEERLRQKLEAQAQAHQEAMEVEHEKKADEARLRLTRARLVAFYLQHNPGKESNIDKILETYEGRYDVLDAKLKQKYGVGFNPALKPKPSTTSTTSKSGNGTNNNNKLSQLFGGTRKEEMNDKQMKEVNPSEVCVLVEPSEILPVICWSKDSKRARAAMRIKKASKLDNNTEELLPLKYYLVDSRPEGAALDQGKFPTSVSLSPEILLDADLIQRQEEKFEALRGSVHICIMGEGYSALPKLYGHKMTRGLSECIREDDARNRNCALFFLKRGFPFVSIVNGGFAAAHSFLCREGPKIHLSVQNVLMDYHPEVSLFGQFEGIQNGTGREKTQRTIQGLFDSSMAAISINASRLEKALVSDPGNNIEKQDHQGKNAVSRFFGIGEQSSKDRANKSGSNAPDTEGFESQDDNLTSKVKSETSDAKKSFSIFKQGPTSNKEEKKTNFFGTAFNKKKSGSSSVASAFSRFSISSAGKTQAAKGGGMSSSLAGIKTISKNTVAKMKGGVSEQSSKVVHGQPPDPSPTIVVVPPAGESTEK